MRIAATADLHYSAQTLGILKEQFGRVRDEADVLVVAPSPTSQKRLVIEPLELSVNVTVNAGMPLSGEPVNAATGAGGTTVTIEVALLLPGVGSGVWDDAVTVLARVPGAAALSTIVTVARALMAIKPRLQTMVPLSLVQVPTLLTAET